MKEEEIERCTQRDSCTTTTLLSTDHSVYSRQRSVSTTDLPIVALEVARVLKREGGEQLNEVSVGCSKQVASVAEGTL